MPRKTITANTAGNTITLTHDEAKELYHLYAVCNTARNTFRECQATSYRNFVQSNSEAATVKRAFMALKDKIDAFEEKEEKPEPVIEKPDEGKPIEVDEENKEGDEYGT